MNDLISRQVAIDALERRKDKTAKGEIGSFYNTIIQHDIDVIVELPSIDAVEVVRCKDCKHRDPEDKKCDFGHDIIWQLPRRDDWYCADGERKDG